MAAFANKLLVLIDGRSVYSPMFGGVYWDAQETALEDIERIEVVRGPGGTLWGANAFHGVINIITRSAASSQGTQLSLSAGDEQKFAASLKHGGRIGEDAHYRFYVKGFERDASRLTSTGASAQDGWRAASAGGRLDFGSEESDAFTVQGDYYYGEAGEPSILNLLRPPYRLYNPTETHYEGASLLGRWQRQLGESDSFTLQAFVDFTRRDWTAHTEEKRLTWDVDFQYHLRSLPRNDLIIGIGMRQGDDAFAAATRGIPADALQFVQGQSGGGVQRLFSLFAQDDISLLPDDLTLTLGAKVEHLPATGTEMSPNARLLWTPADGWSIWGAVSRAVRTPSRVDLRGKVVAAVELPAGFTLTQPEALRGFSQISSPLPIVLQQGSGHVDAERVVSFEAGIKHRFSETLSVDVAAFRNEYDRLRTAQLVPPTCAPGGGIAPACILGSPPGSVQYLVENSPVGNRTDGYGQGVELAIDWMPVGPLRLQGALTVFKSLTEANYAAGEFETDRDSGTPRAQWSLTALWNAGRNTDLTLGLRQVDRDLSGHRHRCERLHRTGCAPGLAPARQSRARHSRAQSAPRSSPGIRLGTAGCRAHLGGALGIRAGHPEVLKNMRFPNHAVPGRMPARTVAPVAALILAALALVPVANGPGSGHARTPDPRGAGVQGLALCHVAGSRDSRARPLHVLLRQRRGDFPGPGGHRGTLDPGSPHAHAAPGSRRCPEYRGMQPALHHRQLGILGGCSQRGRGSRHARGGGRPARRRRCGNGAAGASRDNRLGMVVDLGMVRAAQLRIDATLLQLVEVRQ